jgi:hypothetical protein
MRLDIERRAALRYTAGSQEKGIIYETKQVALDKLLKIV